MTIKCKKDDKPSRRGCVLLRTKGIKLININLSTRQHKVMNITIQSIGWEVGLLFSQIVQNNENTGLKQWSCYLDEGRYRRQRQVSYRICRGTYRRCVLIATQNLPKENLDKNEIIIKIIQKTRGFTNAYLKLE
jgi:hypothetical protein